MTEREAQRLEELCNSMSDTAHGLYNDLMVFARNIGGQGHKLHLHERELMHALDAMHGGLGVLESLMERLEAEMLRAEKLAATLKDTRAQKRHWQGAAYNTRVGRREHPENFV